MKFIWNGKFGWTEIENCDKNGGYWALGCIHTTAPMAPQQSCMSRSMKHRKFNLTIGQLQNRPVADEKTKQNFSIVRLRTVTTSY